MKLIQIKEIAEKKGIAITYIAESIDMSPQNLHRCIRINQIQSHQLEIIAKILEVPVSIFFDDQPQAPAEENIDYKIIAEARLKEIELLKERIKDKEQIIELLEKRDVQAEGTATCAGAVG